MGPPLAGSSLIRIRQPKASWMRRREERQGHSANAGQTKPAKLLAVFVVDTNEAELTIPFGN
jgi:hypothetical protein